jgi:hypothetical protein
VLATIIRELDERILNDPALVQPLFDELTTAQRALGLVFGDRPTCPFLRPHIVTRSYYEQISRAASTIAVAIERMVAQALTDEELLAVLGPTAREEAMARIDPGYARLCVSSRLDSYAADGGFQFLEYNAETPAGVGDQMQLEKILFSLGHLREFLDRHAHWRPEPHRRLLSALIETYREWGGAEDRPQIAIVDWKGVATESEFRVLQQYFASALIPTSSIMMADIYRSSVFASILFTSASSFTSFSNGVRTNTRWRGPMRKGACASSTRSAQSWRTRRRALRC